MRIAWYASTFQRKPGLKNFLDLAATDTAKVQNYIILVIRGLKLWTLMDNDIHTTFHECCMVFIAERQHCLPLFGLHYCQILKSHLSIVSFGREIVGK